MNRSKIFIAIVVSLSIVVSSSMIANYIGHQLYPVQAPENS